jgi:hypothetical protein
MDEVLEAWRDRVNALLQAMRDVYAEPATKQWPMTLTSRHMALFERYLRDLRRAKEGAEKRWDAMVAAEFGRTGDLTHAEQNVEKRIPAGRVADPGVIAIVRRYWSECAALNAKFSEAEYVRPEEFLLDLLVWTTHEDLAIFLSGLPYWPIGMDAEGRWV